MAEILHQLIGSLSHYLQGYTSQVVQDFFPQQFCNAMSSANPPRCFWLPNIGSTRISTSSQQAVNLRAIDFIWKKNIAMTFSSWWFQPQLWNLGQICIMYL